MCAGGEPRFRRLRQLVADVGEISRVRLDAQGDFQRLIHTEMSRMRFVAKRIDDQDFHARDKIDNRIRYDAAVAQVGDKFLV